MIHGFRSMDPTSCDRFCQSCALPMTEDSLYGKEADGTFSRDYCKYCYDRGEFLHDVSMEEFIELCVELSSCAGMTPEKMRAHCTEVFPNLKRWKRG